MFEIAKSKVIAAGAGLALIFTGIGGVAVAGAASPPPAPLAVTQSIADQTGEQIDSENVDATPDVNETDGTAEAPDGAADVETADGVGAPEAPDAGTQVMPALR